MDEHTTRPQIGDRRLVSDSPSCERMEAALIALAGARRALVQAQQVVLLCKLLAGHAMYDALDAAGLTDRRDIVAAMRMHDCEVIRRMAQRARNLTQAAICEVLVRQADLSASELQHDFCAEVKHLSLLCLRAGVDEASWYQHMAPAQMAVLRQQVAAEEAEAAVVVGHLWNFIGDR